jgi:dipeptidyl aminopeptidase/acylaminoacyl peptidase
MRFTDITRLWILISFSFATLAHGAEFKPGESIDLKPGDGLLAVDIEALAFVNSAKIDRIGAVFGGTTLTDLHSGTNTRLITLSAGEYRWSRINLSQGLWYLRVRDDAQFHFKIEPGVLNYIGDLNIAPSGSGLTYRMNLINRSARMMVKLDQDFPGVRRKLSFRYQGRFPDRFPQFASDVLGEQSALEALTAGSADALSEAPKDAPPELRPLITELFARPQVTAVRLNPRGDLLAMIEYRDGKNRVSLLDTHSMQAKDVYRGDAGVRKIAFAGDRTLLYELNQANGWNSHVAHVDTSPGKAPTFSWFQIPDRGWFIDSSSVDGSHATYAHMSSDGNVHIFRINLDGKRFDTGQFNADLRLDKGLEKTYSGLTDAAGTLRLALTTVDGDYAMMYRADAGKPWLEVNRHTADDVFEPLMLSADGSSLIALTNQDRAQTDLVRIDLPSGKVSETMFSASGTDVEGVLARDVDRHILGVMTYRDGNLETTYLDESDDALRRAFARVLPGKSIVTYESSLDHSQILVMAYDELDPGTYYLFDAKASKLQELLPIVPHMPHVQPMRSQILKTTAKDGTPVEGYLTLPAQSQPPFPLVVIPHGGPIGIRDSLRFDPEVQFLANRGYAVLRVNYRGSGGFGKAFEHSGFGAWGKDIEDDILAAIDAAMKAAPIEPDRIGLDGGSYGGYSTLMGLIRTPERFRCGVAKSAVTDVPLMFTSSDWSQNERSREYMKKIVGDPTNALSDMEAISPDYLYRKLDRPLLVIHGAQDQRVSMEHALRLVLLLGNAKKPPQSLFLSKEGHGIVDPDARYLAEVATDRFFATCMSPRQSSASRGSVAH